jgi:hypothetical protein
MAPRITGSANRQKRKAQSSKRPITQGQNPQRSNRQGVSKATVSTADTRNPNRVRAGLNQTNKPNGGRVTGTQGRPKPANPPKVTGGTPTPPSKPLTRQSRVNGRLVAGTDKRQLPSQKPAAKPPGPTPYQVSDPWAKPARPSIGNVSGPASSPNRPAATPKPPTNPAGNFKAPSVPAAGSATKPPVKGTPQAEAWLKEQLKVRGSNALKGSTIGNLKTGVAGAAVQALSDQFLAPQVRRLGTALGKGPLTALGRFIDDRLPGINSKDEARRKDPTKTVVDSRTPRLANSMPSRPVGTRATLNGKSVYWDGYKWTPSSGSPVTASKPNTPKAPKPPAATNTASRSSASSRSSDGSSMSSPVRTSSPKPAAPKKSAPAKPGQKFADFNPGRGTSKTNNPLMKDMVGRMKDREDKAQASAASKLTNRFNTKDSFSGEKVDGSTVNTKAKINSTTSEYDKKKRRYGG